MAAVGRPRRSCLAVPGFERQDARQGPGAAGRPGLPRPRGRGRAAGQAGRPQEHRGRAQRGRLGRQDPRGAGQRPDHAVDLPGRHRGGRGRRRQPRLHHAAEGAVGRRRCSGSTSRSTQIEKTLGLPVGRDRHRGADRERRRPGQRRRDRRRLAPGRDDHLRPGRLHGLDQHEVAGGRRADPGLPRRPVPLHPDADPDGRPDARPAGDRRPVPADPRRRRRSARWPSARPRSASTASGCCTRARSTPPTRSTRRPRPTTTTPS